MSDDSYKPENDEYLNKLIKFDEKRTELIKIHRTVDKLRQELPPDEIKTPPQYNWYKIGGMVAALLVVGFAVYFIFFNNSDTSTTNVGKTEVTGAATSIKDTLNYTFYIMNNVGENHFELNDNHIDKINDILKDNSIYRVNFISQNDNSIEIFNNKIDVINKLEQNISNFGNMDWEGIVTLFYSLEECCKYKIPTKFIMIGKTPTVHSSDKLALKAVLKLKSLTNLNNCTYVDLIQLGFSSNDYEETTEFFDNFYTRFQIYHEFIK